MKRFLNPKFLLLLIGGAAAFAMVSALSQSNGEEHQYGEPDGEISDGSTASFVD